MRSALLEVAGVTRVQVSLETGDVVVTYDPRATTVAALVTVVNNTDGVFEPRQYHATVKVEPRTPSTR